MHTYIVVIFFFLAFLSVASLALYLIIPECIPTPFRSEILSIQKDCLYVRVCIIVKWPSREHYINFDLVNFFILLMSKISIADFAH